MEQMSFKFRMEERESDGLMDGVMVWQMMNEVDGMRQEDYSEDYGWCDA